MARGFNEAGRLANALRTTGATSGSSSSPSESRTLPRNSTELDRVVLRSGASRPADGSSPGRSERIARGRGALVSFSGRSSTSSVESAGESTRLLQALAGRRSRPAAPSNLECETMRAIAGQLLQRPCSAPAATPRPASGRQAPLAESLGQDVEGFAQSRRRPRARPQQARDDPRHRPSGWPAASRSARGSKRAEPGLPALDSIQPPGDLGLAVVEQRMQVLPDDVRDQRIVDDCSAGRRAARRAGRLPAIFRAAMATWSRTSGLGSRAELDDLLADRRLDLSHVPRRADAPGAEGRVGVGQQLGVKAGLERPDADQRPEPVHPGRSRTSLSSRTSASSLPRIAGEARSVRSRWAMSRS